MHALQKEMYNHGELANSLVLCYFGIGQMY